MAASFDLRHARHGGGRAALSKLYQNDITFRGMKASGMKASGMGRLPDPSRTPRPAC
jgi:hypothetical protein